MTLEQLTNSEKLMGIFKALESRRHKIVKNTHIFNINEK